MILCKKTRNVLSDDKANQNRIGFKKSEAKVNMHFHVREEKHTDSRQPLQGLRSKPVLAASLKVCIRYSFKSIRM